MFQVKNKPLPYPKSDQPWGVTKAFFDTEARIPIAQMSIPIIYMIGEKKKKFVSMLQWICDAKKTSVTTRPYVDDINGFYTKGKHSLATIMRYRIKILIHISYIITSFVR